MTSRRDSGSSSSPSAVEPVTSQNRTVTVLRAVDTSLSVGRGRACVLGGALDRLQSHRRLQLLDVLAQSRVRGLLGDVLHEIGEAVGDGVQLVVDRLLGAGLAVLQ